jgi:hypothetical protein
MSTQAWTHDTTEVAIADATSPSGGDIRLGCAGASDFFKGDIAAAACWTRSLTDPEIAGIVNSWGAVLATAPTAAWKLNQNVVTTPLMDFSAAGTANQTARTGTTVVSGDIPNWSESVARYPKPTRPAMFAPGLAR